MYVIEVPCFDLNSIYLSKQAPRWIKISDKKFIIPHKDKALKIEQNKQRIVFDCTEDEALTFWWDYFDLSLDYNELYYKIRHLDGDMKIIANRCKGIHILRQDVFEMIIYSLLDRVEYKNDLMQEIAVRTGVKHGRSMKEMGTVNWFEFPTPERLLKKWNCLKGIDFCENDKKIFEVAELISEGWFDLDALQNFDKQQTEDYFLDFEEFFTDEQINFICLYALHHLDKFPLDTESKFAFDKFGMDYEDFYEWFIDGNVDLENNVGLIRQYLIYDRNNEPQRIEHWMKQ